MCVCVHVCVFVLCEYVCSCLFVCVSKGRDVRPPRDMVVAYVTWFVCMRVYVSMSLCLCVCMCVHMLKGHDTHLPGVGVVRM